MSISVIGAAVWRALIGRVKVSTIICYHCRSCRLKDIHMGGKENGLAKDNPIIPYYLVNKMAMNSGFVEDVDYRHVLGAEVKGCKALTAGYKDVLDYNASYDDPCYNMAGIFLEKYPSLVRGYRSKNLPNSSLSGQEEFWKRFNPEKAA